MGTTQSIPQDEMEARLSADPYRLGYCDYIMGREFNAPWAKGFSPAVMRKNALYSQGWERAEETGIKLTGEMAQLMNKGGDNAKRT